MRKNTVTAAALLFILAFAAPLFCQDHFYTPSAEERDRAASRGYKVEGTCCFVSATAKPGMIPLYRLFNARSGNHFYSASDSERDLAVQAGYKYEGICCYVFAPPPPSARPTASIPLYRLFDPRSGKHFYTTEDSERQTAIRGGLRSEDICCYVANSAGMYADTPFYRLYSPPQPAPNPVQIALGPWLRSPALTTIDYRGTNSYPNIAGRYGCPVPRITSVTNRSAFPIVLVAGIDGDPSQGQLLKPNQASSAFSANDLTGSWEAWGPEFRTGKWYSILIDVSWTC